MSQHEKEYFLGNISSFLRSARGGHSQQEFAEKLGISQQDYQRYESGKMMPGVDRAYEIATRLRVSIEQMMMNQPQESALPMMVKERTAQYTVNKNLPLLVMELSELTGIPEDDLREAIAHLMVRKK